MPADKTLSYFDRHKPDSEEIALPIIPTPPNHKLVNELAWSPYGGYFTWPDLIKEINETNTSTTFFIDSSFLDAKKFLKTLFMLY